MHNHTRLLLTLCTAALAAVFLCMPSLSPAAAPPAVPLGERWFSILIDNEQVGFYHQIISRLPEGRYLITGDGSVRMKIMGFTKEASSREVYRIGPDLALQTVEVTQTINGKPSRISGVMQAAGLKIRREAGGSVKERLLTSKGPIIPGPALNLVPLFKGYQAGTRYRVTTFDPEETALKQVVITATGQSVTPDGLPALKLQNDLYPFVDNDIWIDSDGNTLLESVRDGLVMTRAEQPEKLAAFVSGLALAKKDLIYDFSLIRLARPLGRQPAALNGLTVAVEGYPATLPLLENSWQQTERTNDRLVIRTGAARRAVPPSPGAPPPPAAGYLADQEGIESAAPEIIAKAKELTETATNDLDKARALAAWVAGWLEDSIEDGGGAVVSLTSRRGNCQTHAKLYSALARAAGIPTRFVSGLVSQDGSGFLYHSWAESLIEGRWVAVDPTFNQIPADPTHLAFFEGHRLADLAPLVGVIGKIKVSVLEET